MKLPGETVFFTNIKILNSMWILLEQFPVGIGNAYSPHNQGGPNYYSHTKW